MPNDCTDVIFTPFDPRTTSPFLMRTGGNDMLVPFKAVDGNKQKPAFSFISNSRTGFYIRDGEIWVTLNGLTTFPIQDTTERIFEDLIGAQDGVNLDFEASAPILVGSEIVSINGIPQEFTTHYTINNTTVTFDEPPLAGERLQINYKEDFY